MLSFVSKLSTVGASSCDRLKKEKGRTNGPADQNILYFQNDPRMFKWKQCILNTRNYPGDREVFADFDEDSLNLMNSGAIQTRVFPGEFLNQTLQSLSSVIINS